MIFRNVFLFLEGAAFGWILNAFGVEPFSIIWFLAVLTNSCGIIAIIARAPRIIFNLRAPLIALFDFCSRRGWTYKIPTRDEKHLYLERLRLHPRWLTFGWFRHCIHKFHRSDDVADGVHDHPWLYRSIILKGTYVEHFVFGTALRGPGRIIRADASHLHRVELLKDIKGHDMPVYTFFTMGKKSRRTWGFLVNDIWYPWHVWLTRRASPKQQNQHDNK